MKKRIGWICPTCHHLFWNVFKTKKNEKCFCMTTLSINGHENIAKNRQKDWKPVFMEA